MGFDVGQAFTFVFDEKGWRTRLFPLLLLSFIPGMNVIAWTGYGISVARAVALEQEEALPEWTDWSDILVRGLLSIAAALLYFLPAIIVGGCFALMSLILAERAQGTFLAVRFCAFGFAIVYMLLTSLLLNTGHAHFANTDRFNYSYLNLTARLADLRNYGAQLAIVTIFQLAVAAVGIGILFVGVVVFIVAINLIVRIGVGMAIILIPILLVVLVLLALAVTLAYLAAGYVLGAFAVQFPANAPISDTTKRATGVVAAQPK